MRVQCGNRTHHRRFADARLANCLIALERRIGFSPILSFFICNTFQFFRRERFSGFLTASHIKDILVLVNYWLTMGNPELRVVLTGVLVLMSL